jgi:hypothetical protein
MTIIEAMKTWRTWTQESNSIIKSGKQATYWWLRPKAWCGCGQALVSDTTDFQLVPDPRGGQRASMPSFEEIVGEWEVVPSDVVLKERDRLIR